MVVFWWAVVLLLFVGFWCLGCAIMGSFVWISCSWRMWLFVLLLRFGVAGVVCLGGCCCLL